MYTQTRFRRRNVFRLRAMFLLLFIAGLQRANAQAIVAVATGAAVVKDILNKFDQDARLLLGEANTDGNALIGRFGNELNVATKNANLLLEKDLNIAFNKLDDQTAKVLGSIDQLRMTALHLKNDAFDLKNTTVLDLRRIIGDYLPFNRTTFYIQSIDGISQLQTPTGDYKLDILGIGFGFDADNFKSSITEVDINDKAIKGFKDNKTAANRSIVVIPREAINGVISREKVSQVNAVIKVHVSKRSGILFKTWNNYDYSLPVALTIIPRVLKSFAVTYSVPSMDWVTIRDLSTYTIDLPEENRDCHSHGCIVQFPFDRWGDKLPDNQRYVNPHEVTPPNGACDWTTCEYVHLEDNDHQIHGHFLAWGPRCTRTIGATIQEYKQVGNESKAFVISEVEYGNTIEITLPSNSVYWKIKGKTADLNDVTIVGKTGYSNLIQFSDRIDLGTEQKIIYKVGYPF